MKYSRYPSYKDSHSDWLGNVPDEWSIVRNKQAFSFEKDLVGKKSNEYTLLSLTLQGIKIRDIESGKGKFPAEFDTYQIVEKNDIIFCLFDIDETPRTVGLSSHNGMITGAYNVARCNTKALPAYMYYYYLSIDEYKGLKPYYTGLRKVVRTETFMNIQLALPSFQEQQTIANYLDKATVKIDTLIEKQTRLIELLKEKRQAVISTAVTRGLDSTVAMKDSEVEWLGEIPEGWEVKRLKQISPKIGVGLVINPSTYTRDEGVYYIFGGDVKEFMFDLTNTRRMSPEDSKRLLPSRLRARDLVSIRVGYPGITAVVTDELDGANCASVIIIRRGNFNSDWLCAAMNSWIGKQQVSLASYGAAQKQYNVNDAIEFVFPVPPIEEQKTIANFIANKTSKIDNLITKLTKAIDLLKEKRTALISSVVTGKIDVREVM